MRQPLVVANWKMHGSRASVDGLLDGMLGALPRGVECAVCPSHVHVAQAAARCAGSDLGVGAQDCSRHGPGAHTGEVAAAMLADLGCRWVIIGHSERRRDHAEDDALLAAKLAAAVEAGLRPILCVGETRKEREAGDAQAVVAAQLAGALHGQAGLARLVVAYEPVWAIGTGLTATPEQAQEMHAFVRGILAGTAGVDAAATRLLYGGSVKPENAGALFAEADIDGALVGGASLVAGDFVSIAGAAAS